MRTLFTDPNRSVEGVLTPDGGSPTTVRCIVEVKSPQFGEASSPGKLVRLWADPLPAVPADGDVLAIGATTYTVRSAEPDGLGLSHVMDVDEQVSP